MHKSNVFFIAVLILTFANHSKGQATEKGLEALLQDFDDNSEKFMNELPPKKFPAPVGLFSDEAIANKSYVAAKNKLRPFRGRAEVAANDRAENLVDNGDKLIRTLEEMDKKSLRSASLKENPWSDHYWPYYSGEIAFRYADDYFPLSKDWKVNRDYVLSHIAASSIASLSPAEKYDLLVGDSSQTLTRYALSEGESLYKESGVVAEWMGICHGWAPAAYMLLRPTHSIKVMTAKGYDITFYPSDIKALASLLWANASTPTKFIGGRCNVRDPKTDENGRVIDQDCFDSNPGTWHLVVVNQIGINKRAFVIDATYDYEVWNQPVYAYSYQFYNPQTLKPVNTIAEATVDMKNFTHDKFSKYRSKKSVAVVGISMDVTYTLETMPTATATNSSQNDASNTVNYQYDLELDSNKNIIGGEWYRNTHPDFIWTPIPKAIARTAGDELLVRAGTDKIPWTGKTPFPKEWVDAAQKTSKLSPLGIVVEALIQISQAGI